jgi:hypothetical protein
MPMSRYEEPGWETLFLNVHRIAVPGGWIYEIDHSDTGASAVFVPHPSTTAIEILDEIVAALRDIDKTIERLKP